MTTNRRIIMTTSTPNRFTRHLLLAAAVALAEGSTAFAAGQAGPQEQARTLLSGVAAEGIEFPSSRADLIPVDPQTRAQWLLGGRSDMFASPAVAAQSPSSDISAASTQTDASNADGLKRARQLLAGNAF